MNRKIALLAPVPTEHLVSALNLLEKEEKVAFGSMAFFVFDKLESERAGHDVDVYIYASAAGDDAVSRFWRASYIGFVPSDAGSHPEGMKYRPESTDDEGSWGLFWEVKNLRPAATDDWCPIAEMTGYGNKRPYGRAFVPERPILIKHPSKL